MKKKVVCMENGYGEYEIYTPLGRKKDRNKKDNVRKEIRNSNKGK